ncbi:MAG TPA: hypothetical protein PKC68_00270 [Alphaproteobacteria bacterium]|nr:hypothetical protein [Alphaproteobacteria bacterium]
MPKPSRVFSETIRLDRDDHVNFKTWIAPILNYDGEPLTKKDALRAIIRKFLSRKDWQQSILDDIELKRQVYQEMTNSNLFKHPKKLEE